MVNTRRGDKPFFFAFLSFLGFEDPPNHWTRRMEHPINHLNPKRLHRTGGEGALLFLEQTLGLSTTEWVKQSTMLVGWHVFSG